MTDGEAPRPLPPWIAVAPASGSTVNPDAPLITRRARGGASRVLREPLERTQTTDADLVAPARVDRRAFDSVRCGQSYLRTFAVLALPRMLAPGALVTIMHLPGVQTALVNHPVPRSLAKERLTQLAQQMGVSLAQGGEAGVDEALALKDIRRTLAAIVDERAALHLVGLYLTVAGADLHELNERTRVLRSCCTDAQLTIVAVDAQHWEGVLTTAPLGDDRLRYRFETDTPTLARLLPASTTGIHRGAGVPILYGVRADGDGAGQVAGMPVLLDRMTLPSPHQAVIAATGSGKTYHQSLLILQRFAHGQCDLCVLDPKDQEYRALIEEVLGGTYLVLSERAAWHIIPTSGDYLYFGCRFLLDT